MGNTNKKRLVMSEPMILTMELMDDDNERVELIKTLIAYGKGEHIDVSGLYLNVRKACEYLTNAKRIDSIFIDDHFEFE